MKAVNLLPREAQRSFGTLRGLGASTTAVVAALAIGLVLVTSYVVLANRVSDKRQQLSGVNAQVAAAQNQVAELKPYADLEDVRQSLLGRVRTLADSRFDWPRALDRIARAFPSDASLTSFEGSPVAAGVAPTVSLSGCTPSHNEVARLIDRLRAVRGVTGVALQSSTVAEQAAPGSAEGSGCPHAEQFQLRVQLEGPAGAAGAATGTTGPAAATGATGPAAPAATASTPTPTPGGTS
jgi:Tfp pilus assembly protein PilN